MGKIRKHKEEKYKNSSNLIYWINFEHVQEFYPNNLYEHCGIFYSLILISVFVDYFLGSWDYKNVFAEGLVALSMNQMLLLHQYVKLLKFYHILNHIIKIVWSSFNCMYLCDIWFILGQYGCLEAPFIILAVTNGDWKNIMSIFITIEHVTTTS